MNKPSPVLLICVTVLGIAALVAVVVLVAVVPDDSDLPTLMGALLTPTISLIGILAALGRIEQTKSTVDDLANGKMDAKIRAGVADVLADHFIDPAAVQQLAKDRARRDEQHD